MTAENDPAREAERIEHLFDALRQQLADADDLWLARGRSLAIRNKW